MNKIKLMISHLRELRPIRERVDAAKEVIASILESGFDDEGVARLSRMREELEGLQREVPATLKALRQSTSKKRRG